MAAPSKTKKIESFAKVLQKRCKGVPLPTEKTVLEHLIYAALLENTGFDLADSAYAVLENYFIDWNEIRVSTVGELADTFSMLPDPLAAGGRVRRALQGVFEKTYMFDLEELVRKGKNLGHAVEFLESLGACSRFMIDYTAQFALGSHVIPLDEASLRIFRLLGLAQVDRDGTKEEVPGLERAIAKKNGPLFSTQLHHFAAGFFSDPESEELRTILKPVDAEILKRDWTPPVLTLPKTAPKTPSKPEFQREIAVIPPFVAPDEDDFDEEPIGTEAEFISDEVDYRPDDVEKSRKSDGTSDESANTKKDKGKKKASGSSSESVKPKPTKQASATLTPPKSEGKTDHSQASTKTKKNLSEGTSSKSDETQSTAPGVRESKKSDSESKKKTAPPKSSKIGGTSSSTKDADKNVSKSTNRTKKPK